MNALAVDDIEQQRYLVFRLADELYASALVSIREIIKLQAVKPVPFMASYFRGILNLRGQIVSVVDLRLKLELNCPDKNKGLMIVIDTANGPIAAVVDDVVLVQEFPPESISQELAIKTKIRTEFFNGVAKLGDRLVNIIDIGATLTDGDFALVKRMNDQSTQKIA